MVPRPGNQVRKRLNLQDSQTRNNELRKLSLQQQRATIWLHCASHDLNAAMQEGEARGVVQGLTQTTANYKISCELLEERYGDPENIISAHLQTLMQLGSSRNTKTEIHTSSLRKLQNYLVDHVCSLEALGVGGGQYWRILVPMILALLPHDIRLEWSCSGRKRGDLEGLLKFLQQEVEGRERAEAIKRLGLGKSEEPCVERRTKKVQSQFTFYPSSEESASKMLCALCGKLHLSERCTSITKLPLSEREEAVRNRLLCFKCLSTVHYAKGCWAKCSNCKIGSHNSLICQKSETKPSVTASENNPAVGVQEESNSLTHVGLAPCEVKTRPVVWEGSLTTKVRPVFDGSARGSNGVSLNDCLESGPSLNSDLVEVLLRFRRWKVALTAYVTKALLQIKYENLYVDDWLSGADSPAEAGLRFKEANDILQEAGMSLSKCTSNCKTLTRTEGSSEESVKVLGLHWHCPGKDNPADLVSRGVFAEQLLQSDIWLRGPPWLCSSPLPNQEGRRVEIPSEELCDTDTVCVVVENDPPLFEFTRWSSFTKALNVVGWVLRFVGNCRPSSLKLGGPLTYGELTKAKIAKKICRECVACRRCDTMACSQPLGPLLELGVKSAPPFMVKGLDFAGEEPDIANPLTPSHFLIGRSAGFQLELADDPASGVSSKDLCVREAICLCQLDKFWRIWQSEYLRNLPCMVKRFKPNCNLKEGSVVQVNNEWVSRLMWLLGVITKLCHGKDGIILSVEVITRRGFISRPVQNLYNLEITDLKGGMGRNSQEDENLRQKPAESPSVSNVGYTALLLSLDMAPQLGYPTPNDPPMFGLEAESSPCTFQYAFAPHE
ncbi:uncharacterized protein [Palaemon carinicauda]|uniref:uncharacterized protein n=1 Tax=Palaemon carinicauda TaxID=392227 RepID=UPI0035B5B9C4